MGGMASHYGMGGMASDYGMGGMASDYGMGGMASDYGMGGMASDLGGMASDYGMGGIYGYANAFPLSKSKIHLYKYPFVVYTSVSFPGTYLILESNL